MSDLERKPMSAILKEMAQTLFVDPAATPSTEAAAAALLLSHVAWERANGVTITDAAYLSVIAVMQKARPDFWMELRSTDAAGLILELMTYKRRHYLHDTRKVIMCDNVDSRVRVEWTD